MAKSRYQSVKEWRSRNKDKVAAQGKRRREKHRDRLSAQQLAWKKRNIEHVRQMDAANQKKRRANNPEAQKLRMARFKAKQEQMLTEIAGRPRQDQCELCGDVGKTVFDHCHATGKFRGWICDRCNKTLGHVKDSVLLLEKMINYLKDGGKGYGKTNDKTEEPTTGLRFCITGEKISSGR